MPKGMLAAFGVSDQVNLFTPEGFLQGQLFALMVPLLLIIQGVGIGSATIAGEEERGQLEVVAAHPVSRTRLFLEKLGVLVVALLFSSLLLFLSVWLGLERTAHGQVAVEEGGGQKENQSQGKDPKKAVWIPCDHGGEYSPHAG